MSPIHPRRRKSPRRLLWTSLACVLVWLWCAAVGAAAEPESPSGVLIAYNDGGSSIRFSGRNGVYGADRGGEGLSGFTNTVSPSALRASANPSKDSLSGARIVQPLQKPAPDAAAKPVDAAWRIKIREAVAVPGPNVSLGEIADPVGEVDQALWDELAKVALFPAPVEARRPMLIQPDRLAPALKERLGEAAGLCVVPKRFVIQTGGAAVLPEELYALVVNVLTPKVAALGGRAEFREFQTPNAFFKADPLHRLNVEIPAEAIKPGRVAFRIEERDFDDKPVARFSASVFLDVWKAVPTAKRPLNRGELVDETAFVLEEKNLAFARPDLWDGAGSFVVKTPVGTGQSIHKADLDVHTLVKKGDAVKIVYESKRIRLEVPALVVSAGNQGEAVTVRNLQSQKQITATVRDAQTVAVH